MPPLPNSSEWQCSGCGELQPGFRGNCRGCGAARWREAERRPRDAQPGDKRPNPATESRVGKRAQNLWQSQHLVALGLVLCMPRSSKVDIPGYLLVAQCKQSYTAQLGAAAEEWVKGPLSAFCQQFPNVFVVSRDTVRLANNKLLLLESMLVRVGIDSAVWLRTFDPALVPVHFGIQTGRESSLPDPDPNTTRALEEMFLSIASTKPLAGDERVRGESREREVQWNREREGNRSAERANAEAADRRSDDMEWFYTNQNGQKQGPVAQRLLKQHWQRGEVDGGCLAWNRTMTDWKEIRELPALMAFLADRSPGDSGPGSGERWGGADRAVDKAAARTPEKLSDADQAQAARYWYFTTVEGKRSGPELGTRLKDVWLTGAVDASCLAWTENMTEWLPIQDVPNLIAFLDKR